jgi:hypothetical protein
MSDGRSKTVPAPARRGVRWTSFVGSPAQGRVSRGLEEEGHPEHRVRVEHNKHTLLIHVSHEDGRGWTTIAIDRPTREWAVAQRARQLDAAKAAYGQLYD